MGKKNINDISYIFKLYSPLEILPYIKWNIINANNTFELFFECSSLKSLPDISNWDTSNVINMSYLFYKCSSLKLLV